MGLKSGELKQRAQGREDVGPERGKRSWGPGGPLAQKRGRRTEQREEKDEPEIVA